MNILIYKRTHAGDPGPDGCFGIYDCMGVVRDRDFDAVIGVGGIGAEAQANRIAGKVNWIGVGPHKAYVANKRGPEVTFDHFVYYGSDGPGFSRYAPVLAKRMYEENVRSILQGLHDQEREEASRIIALAKDAPPSPSLSGRQGDLSSFDRCRRTGKTIRCSQPVKPGDVAMSDHLSPLDDRCR